MRNRFQLVATLAMAAAACAACGVIEHPADAVVIVVEKDASSQDVQQDNGPAQQPEIAQTADIAQDNGPATKPECAVDSDCDDKNPCTTDVCGSNACVHVANSVSCDDGNACTSNDKCGSEKCSGDQKVCDDNNPCTDDGCVSDGTCLHGVNIVNCDDSDACTEKDQCANGKCVGQVKSCDDKDNCTTESCDKLNGCSSTPVVCQDAGDPCTTESCDKATGKCSSTTDCDDKDVTTLDACEPLLETVGMEKCLHIKMQTKCTKNADCDEDGDPCSFEFCSQIGYCASKWKLCDDGDYCTQDECVPQADYAWCKSTQYSCDDYNACTLDSCTNGYCQHKGNAAMCDDKDSTTADSCNPSQGCVNTPIPQPGVPSSTPPSNPSTCAAWGAWIYLPTGNWRGGYDLTGSSSQETDLTISVDQWYGFSNAHSVWAWLKPWGSAVPASVKCTDRCGVVFPAKISAMAGGFIAICSTDQK